MKKIFVLATLLAFIEIKAQDNNFYLDGDNYVAISNSNFSPKTDWTDLSNSSHVTGEFPIETYWFVNPNNAHIIVHLSNENNEFFVELSGKKPTYNFPADYSIDQGKSNNIEIDLLDKNGRRQEIYPDKKSKFVIHVDALDLMHLKLTMDGTLSSAYGSLPIQVKINISRKNASLEKLPDDYPGCDNTIYNTMSPNSDLGQWRSATECEESFYKKFFTALSHSLSPVVSYFQSQGWDMSSVPQYKPLNKRLKLSTTEFFSTNPFTTHIDYDMNVSANPTKGAYQEYIQKVLQLAQDGKMQELASMKDEEGNRFKLHLQVFLNEPMQSNYTLDLSNAEVKKISESVFEISNVPCKSGCTYFDDGGTYLFIGNWTEPVLADGHIKTSPQFGEGSKKLSIQAFYIRIGCGKALAETVISHIDLNALQSILKITP